MLTHKKFKESVNEKTKMKAVLSDVSFIEYENCLDNTLTE